ncbi:hypothetical protein GCM10020221_34630 [Streptomyces thioluteus]|uniref:MFS transporter n=1 Tax=Streptomyces thioluteus TaxID=66431 RepID=A0ABP6JK01_STRTU
MPQLGPPVGFLLANGISLWLSAALTDAEFRSWGWRVPFWAAGVLAAAGLLLRSQVAESPVFREPARRGPGAPAPRRGGARPLAARPAHRGRPLRRLRRLLRGHHLVSRLYGTERLGVDRTVMLGCVMAAVAVMGIATPPLALIADRVGRRTMCLTGCAATVLWMFPLVALLRTGRPALMLLGFTGAMLAFMITFAVVGAYLPELYEPRVRCTGASVGYNLAGVVGGGLTPVAATALTRGDGPPWGLAVLLVAIALVSLGCFLLLPETRPVPAAAGTGHASDVRALPVPGRLGLLRLPRGRAGW